jgi:hypothetical protein
MEFSAPPQTELWSDATLTCAIFAWNVHQLFVSRDCEFWTWAFSGNFIEANKANLDLTKFCSPRVLQLALEWYYVDKFLEMPTLHKAMDILKFRFAVLCPRLSHHAVSACLIPAVDEDNVLEMMSLAKCHSLEQVENKCTEVIGCCQKSRGHTAEFLHLLCKELADTVQGGYMHVTDVPMRPIFDVQFARAKMQSAKKNPTAATGHQECSPIVVLFSITFFKIYL